MRQTLSVIACTCVALALAAIATRYFHPHWALSLAYNLQMHLAVACGVVLVAVLLFGRHPIAWILFAVSLVFAGHAVVMNREFEDTVADEGMNLPTLRVLSFNTLGNNFAGASDLTRFISESGADIVNLMEAQPFATRVDELARVYPYRIGCGSIIALCDQMLLSKVPIESHQVRTLSDIYPQRFMMGTVVIQGQRITIVGIHTTKPYFDGFHAAELNWAAHFINLTEGAMVVAGDFNASTLDVNMRQFLKRTDLRSAGWEPATWPISAGMFGVPIDHIYARAPLRIKSLVATPQAFGSNHYGLMAEIAIGDH